MSTGAAQQYDQPMDAQRPKRVKVTVSLDPERLEKARRAVELGRAPSISAWFELALTRLECNFGWENGVLQELIAELEQIYGPCTPDEEAWAERVLSGL
jgi:hypothetical protein